ncbi:MAG: Fe-S cluster assembly ATPase SufC [Lachnospiraceae bacterium]|nr:Fe-S cluster assembly ATPase SufC [Lachnospiraceae bacterium]
MSKLLEVKDLSVGIADGQILKNVNLTINPGEIHVLMGPNGAGKSTLGNALMGSPVYNILSGKILFDGEDITDFTPDKRAKAGMFMSFQNPLEVPGISLESFIRNSIRQKTGKPIKIFSFKKEMDETMELLNMDSSYADRDLNVGFSGGEKKKAEILQMLMLAPKFAILDETDSGLDVDAVRTVSKGIREYQKRTDGALLIITHNASILEALDVNYAHVLVKGKLITSGGPELVETINKKGFEEFIREAETDHE